MTNIDLENAKYSKLNELDNLIPRPIPIGINSYINLWDDHLPHLLAYYENSEEYCMPCLDENSKEKLITFDSKTDAFAKVTSIQSYIVNLKIIEIKIKKQIELASSIEELNNININLPSLSY